MYFLAYDYKRCLIQLYIFCQSLEKSEISIYQHVHFSTRNEIIFTKQNSFHSKCTVQDIDFMLIYFLQLCDCVQKRSSLENYTSNNTIQHECNTAQHNTRQHDTARVQNDTTRENTSATRDNTSTERQTRAQHTINFVLFISSLHTRNLVC